MFILALTLLWPVVRHPGWWLWTPGAGYSDLGVTHWPSAHFTRRTLWEYRQFPLWRSTIMSGIPFAANPLVGLYYPPNWLFLFLPWLPLEVGFNLSALAHLWLAGAAMCALLRRGFGVGMWGALTGEPWFYLSRGEWAALEWLRNEGESDRVVLCAPQMGLFVPAWAGQPVVYGHPFETVDAERREAQVEGYWAGEMSPAEQESFLRENGVGYVLVGPREVESGEWGVGSCGLVFEAGDVNVYEVK